MARTRSVDAFDVVNTLVLLLAALATLVPFLHVVSKSVSSVQDVIAGRIFMLPRGFTLDSYRFAFDNTPVATAFRNTVFVTSAGTALALLVCTMTAYPLSITALRGRKAILYYFVFTMLFSGGLIPSFLLMRQLGLLNSLWSLVLPHLLEVFQMLIIKSYFEGLPGSIRESAMIDGAGDLSIYLRIVLPVSGPILATMTVLLAVAFWNSYFNAMLYLSKPDKVTLQLFLVNIVRQADNADAYTSEAGAVAPDTVRSAAVVIGTVPILLVYPFVQRHFVKGIVMGSVKG